MKKSYHTINKHGKANERKWTECLSQNGQLLLPMVCLIEQRQWACDELIDVTGRAALQAVLQFPAEQVAGGSPQQGKRRNGEVVCYDQQPRMVMLSDQFECFLKQGMVRIGDSEPSVLSVAMRRICRFTRIRSPNAGCVPSSKNAYPQSSCLGKPRYGGRRARSSIIIIPNETIKGKGSLLLYPSPDAAITPGRRTVRCRDRLGGLLRYYSRAA